MARPRGAGYVLFTCPECDYSSKEKGYGVLSARKGSTPKCPQCGKVKMVEEDRHHRFLRVGTDRARKVQADLQEITSLASPNYKWEPAEIKRLFAALHAEVDKTQKAFEKPATTEPDFTF